MAGPGPKLIAIEVGSSFLYMGLAILGMGGFTVFFSHPQLIVVTIAFFTALVIAFFTSGNLNPGEKEDKANRWVFGAISALALLLAFVPAYTDRINFWTLDGESVRWVGVALFIAGGVLRMWPVFVLGPRFSGLVAIQKEHELVTAGVYSMIRHPSYLGLLVNSAGWALAFRSGLGLIIAASFLIPLIARMNSEERLLCAHFGAAYETYRKRTWRLIPGLY